MPFFAKSRSRMTSCSPPWPRAEHLRHAGQRRREVAVLRDDAHAAGPLGDQHPAIGQEGERPGIGRGRWRRSRPSGYRRPASRKAGIAVERSMASRSQPAIAGAATADGNLMGGSPRAAHGCATDRSTMHRPGGFQHEHARLSLGKITQINADYTFPFGPLAIMAVSPPIASNSNPISTAMASGAGSPSARIRRRRRARFRSIRRWPRRPSTRPVLTVVINPTKATGRGCDSAVWEGAALQPRPLDPGHSTLPRIRISVVLVARIAGDAGAGSSGLWRRR